MELQIGPILSRARHAKGLTQEQLAAALGVSAAAVSKWETGASYPDITLLPPLARALGLTVDCLLDFRAQPTDEELKQITARLSAVFESEGYEAGKQACEAQLRDYPTCAALKIAIGNLYYRYISLALQKQTETEAEQTMQDMMEQTLALSEQGEQQTADPALQKTARVMRISVLTMLCRYDEAEAILGATPPSPQIDTETFYPSLYLAKGDYDKAEAYCRRKLKQHVFQAGLTLMNLTAAARRKDDQPTAQRMADAFQSLYALFQLHPANAIHMQLLIALDDGDAARALDLFGQYVDALPALQESDVDNPFFLSEAPDRALSSSEWEAMNRLLLRNAETEPSFAPLRGQPQFEAALTRLRTRLAAE